MDHRIPPISPTGTPPVERVDPVVRPRPTRREDGDEREDRRGRRRRKPPPEPEDRPGGVDVRV